LLAEKAAPRRCSCRTAALSIDRFARDFPAGLAADRYLAASLPALPFPDRHFDLVLSAASDTLNACLVVPR
jgi:hypothetical protein